jgi:dATP pyrophosphohydrolase
MARAPFNVLVYLYRRIAEDQLKYALFRRADAEFWQGIAGGGEDDETPLAAARRETFEETGLSPIASFLQLDTVAPVPVTEFKDSHLWGEDVYVIPQYCFGALVDDGGDIVLSHEHTAYQWLRYEDAYRLLKFDSDKTALWELDKRLSCKA